jgi:hypothetical protein
MNRAGLMKFSSELCNFVMVGFLLVYVYFALVEKDPSYASLFKSLTFSTIFLSLLLQAVLVCRILRASSSLKGVGSFSHKVVSLFLSKRIRERILDQSRQDDLSSLAESLAKGDRADASYFRFRLRFFPFWVCITSVWEAIGNRLAKLRIK